MDELISKRAVIEAIEKARANVGHNLERSIGKSIIEILDDVGRDIDRLPSALGTNLAEVGTDCISRQQAIDALERAKQNIHHNIERAIGDAVCGILDEVENGIKQLPPIQPELQYKTNYGFMWLCPKCGLPIHSDYTRCVRCGHNREKGV